MNVLKNQSSWPRKKSEFGIFSMDNLLKVLVVSFVFLTFCKCIKAMNGIGSRQDILSCAYAASEKWAGVNDLDSRAITTGRVEGRRNCLPGATDSQG